MELDSVAKRNRLDGNEWNQLPSGFQWAGGHLEQGELSTRDVCSSGGAWNWVSSLMVESGTVWVRSGGIWNCDSSFLEESGTVWVPCWGNLNYVSSKLGEPGTEFLPGVIWNRMSFFHGVGLWNNVSSQLEMSETRWTSEMECLESGDLWNKTCYYVLEAKCSESRFMETTIVSQNVNKMVVTQNVNKRLCCVMLSGVIWRWVSLKKNWTLTLQDLRSLLGKQETESYASLVDLS